MSGLHEAGNPAAALHAQDAPAHNGEIGNSAGSQLAVQRYPNYRPQQGYSEAEDMVRVRHNVTVQL